MIVLFKGKISEIPEGWLLCDGTSGTPDLSNKFVKCSKISKQIGGSDNVCIDGSNIPAHSHQNNQTNQTGNHRHGYYGHDDMAYQSASGVVTVRNHTSGNRERETNSIGHHRHTITSTDYVGMSSEISLNPSYVYLLFIKAVI